MCKNCYEALRRAGVIPRRNDTRCSIDGCERLICGWGLCEKHYRRQLHTGRTDLRTPVERFWPKIDKPEDPQVCWRWTGHLGRAGYGRFRIAGVYVPAHRAAYELMIGPVPDGLVLDHLCKVKSCVNPAHLEPVTFRENILRGDNMAARWARRETCERGHPFDHVNKRGARVCRTCRRIDYAERKRRSS